MIEIYYECLKNSFINESQISQLLDMLIKKTKITFSQRMNLIEKIQMINHKLLKDNYEKDFKSEN